METMTRRKRKRNLLPVVLAVVLAVIVAALALLVFRSLLPAAQREEPDPHAGQIYVNDGAKAAESGVEFAVIRLGFRGYGKGALQPDDLFDSHLDGAHTAGIDAGVYFFSQALTAEEGREEAQYVLERLKGRKLELPVYFDWEPISAEDSRTNGYDYANLTDSAVAFCQTIQAAGYQAGVYINRQQGYYHYDLSRLADYSLWVADYNAYPDFYYRFDMWQYSANGQVNGFDIQVDQNLLFVPKNAVE